MLNRARHHFLQTAPTLIFGGALFGAWRVISTLRRVAGAGPASGLTALLGEGIDEFSARLGSTGPSISSMIVDSNTWIGLTALVATGITVTSAVQQFSENIQSPGDAASMLRHIASRMSYASGNRTIPVRWGEVRDYKTGAPLTYARVDMLDAQGEILATAVTDQNGAFGFASPLSQINQHGGIGAISVRKGGYRQHVITPHVQTHNSQSPFVAVMMRSSHASATEPVARSTVRRVLATAAFWGGVVTVPMFVLSSPSISTATLGVLFGCAVIGRAIFSSGSQK